MTPFQYSPVKAVLFDLDDTLFDHQLSCRRSLAALSQNYACFRQAEPHELEQIHTNLLNELHFLVLQGALSLDEARLERFRRLFLYYGEDVSAATAENAASLYRLTYQRSRQAVPGSIALIEALRALDIRIAVVTNNLVAEQMDKLQACGLTPLIDAVVISEEVGAIKPDRAIFEVALKRVKCAPHEAIMIGDSWSADIIGANKVGIRAIWLNRYNYPCPDETLAFQVNSFEPLDRFLQVLFSVSV